MANEGEHELNVLKCMLEQNWLHARHVENERLLFTSIYAAIAAGILAYLGKANIPVELYRIILLFLMVLSVVGFIVSAKLGAEFKNHIENIENILNQKIFSTYKNCMGLPLNVGVWKKLKVRYAFMFLYISTFILWLALLLYSL